MHQLLVIACGVRGDSPLLILLHQVGVWLGEVCLLYPVDHCAFSHQPFILSASCWFLDPVPTYIVFRKTENVNIVLLCELPEYHEFEIPIGLWDDASYILETIQIMLLFFPSSWPHNSQWPGIVASSKVGAGSITVGGSIVVVQHAGWWASPASALDIGLMMLGQIYVCGLWLGVDWMRN